MHEGSDGSLKFIFDLMEPERPKVYRAVLDFVRGHVFDPADFAIRADVFAGLIRKWRGCWWLGVAGGPDITQSIVRAKKRKGSPIAAAEGDGSGHRESIRRYHMSSNSR